eukprot:scaffold310_cov335-Pavlova_lutheri.AAC.60
MHRRNVSRMHALVTIYPPGYTKAGLEVWTAAQYAIALQRLEWPSSVDVMFVLQPWEILRSDQENVPHVPVSWNTRPLLLYESLHVISTDHMHPHAFLPLLFLLPPSICGWILVPDLQPPPTPPTRPGRPQRYPLGRLWPVCPPRGGWLSHVSLRDETTRVQLHKGAAEERVRKRTWLQKDRVEEDMEGEDQRVQDNQEGGAWKGRREPHPTVE